MVQTVAIIAAPSIATRDIKHKTRPQIASPGEVAHLVCDLLY
jgi:hypothetical protein